MMVTKREMWLEEKLRFEGPDRFGDYNILGDENALAIAAVVSNMRLPVVTRAYARRLVAAWNAVQGIETETLESGPEGWIAPIVESFVEDTATASESVERMYSCAVTNKARADEAVRLLRYQTKVLDAHNRNNLHSIGMAKAVTDARAFLAGEDSK